MRAGWWGLSERAGRSCVSWRRGMADRTAGGSGPRFSVSFVD